jgi:hypothetical protein
MDRKAAELCSSKRPENLCRQGKQRIQSIQRNCKRLTLVVALQQKKTPKSLDDILAACPLHLQLPIEHQLQHVVKALLKSVEKKFTRGMKFEGGPDGRYVQLCARRILKDHDRDDDIDKGIDSALQKVYDRQLKRLMGMKELGQPTPDCRRSPRGYYSGCLQVSDQGVGGASRDDRVGCCQIIYPIPHGWPAAQLLSRTQRARAAEDQSFEVVFRTTGNR